MTHGEDGLWYARFETDEQHEQPEPNIAGMMAVIESLAEPLRTVWSGCTRGEFNIGYDCGSKQWAFNQGLSSQLLGAHGGSWCIATDYAVPASARDFRRFAPHLR